MKTTLQMIVICTKESEMEDKITYEDCRELTMDLNKKLQYLKKDFIYFLGGVDNENSLYIVQVGTDSSLTNVFAGGTVQSTYNCLITMHSMIESYPLVQTLNNLQENKIEIRKITENFTVTGTRIYKNEIVILAKEEIIIMSLDDDSTYRMISNSERIAHILLNSKEIVIS